MHLLRLFGFLLLGRLIAWYWIDIAVVVLVPPALLHHGCVDGWIALKVALVEDAIFYALEDLEGTNYGSLLTHMDPP